MAAVSPTATSSARQPRAAARAVGRYRRWHVNTVPVQEDDIWMMTYLDVFTLMLVMMIVMLAFAGPGKGKDGKSKEESQAAPTAATAGPVPGAPPAAAPSGSIVPPPPNATPAQPEPARPTPKTLNGFELDKLGSDIEVLMNDDAVRFRISTELLFESGNANFAAAGQPALDKLIPLLNADPNLRLVIEGHTDGIPIHTERFPSNWELSTGRAAAVARYLIEHGVAPQRVQASGFADTRPLGSRDNPVDRVHNRRVELTMERPAAEKKPAR
ncbi:OmpA/MotB family protein [Hydrogenophaga sp. MI9]|uniref:OmpA/MotB family protein n=1 Tax=Hydrogenophaga sp. MI9 TaxID=3453719 RepID=UPI003EEEE9D1